MSVLVLCKFTPLGFETIHKGFLYIFHYGVNLPRWGLKLLLDLLASWAKFTCKFTPLGFETSRK